MLKLFKKKSEKEVLQKKHEKLMAQWHQLSSATEVKVIKNMPKRRRY